MYLYIHVHKIETKRLIVLYFPYALRKQACEFIEQSWIVDACMNQSDAETTAASHIRFELSFNVCGMRERESKAYVFQFRQGVP